MQDTKLKDRYDDFLADNLEELAGTTGEYADGYLDGSYAFFADLLGKPL